MIVATLILILSASMFFFYFQVTCQRILRRQFDREYFQSIANANHLEFLTLRESRAGSGDPAAYSRLCRVLEYDFLALTYLLKNAANVNQRYANEERFLIFYFHFQFLSLAVRHLLKLGENQVIHRLTSVLQYFANVLGQRIDAVKFSYLIAAGNPLSF